METVITIHCSDSPNGKKYSAERIDADHKKRGFDRIGYHFVIQPDGQIEFGRNVFEQGAHVEGHNQNNIGICLIGRDRYTKKQFKSLRMCVYYVGNVCFDEMRTPSLYCHYEWDTAKGKTCPNMRVSDVVGYLMTDDQRMIEKYLLSA